MRQDILDFAVRLGIVCLVALGGYAFMLSLFVIFSLIGAIPHA